MKRLSLFAAMACVGLLSFSCADPDGDGGRPRGRGRGGQNGAHGDDDFNSQAELWNVISMGDKETCVNLPTTGKHYCFGRGQAVKADAALTQFKVQDKSLSADAIVMAGQRYFLAFESKDPEKPDVHTSGFPPAYEAPINVTGGKADLVKKKIVLRRPIETKRRYACFIAKVDSREDQLVCSAGKEGIAMAEKEGLFKAGVLQDGLFSVINLGDEVKKAGIKAASGNQWNIALLLNDGRLRWMGANQRNQMQDGNKNSEFTPIALKGYEDHKFTDVSVGGHDVKGFARDKTSMCALTEDGKAVCAGDLKEYEVSSDGTAVSSPFISGIAKGALLKAIAVGGKHLAVLTRNGDLYIEGDNTYGQAGKPSNIKEVKSSEKTPVTFPDANGVEIKKFAAVFAGEASTGVIVWRENENDPIRIFFAGRNAARSLFPRLGDEKIFGFREWTVAAPPKPATDANTGA